MKAAVCYEFNKPLVIEEVDLVAPKKGEVKVRVSATAICHSDIHDIKGDFGGKMPFVGGHETAGYVEEVGEGVNSVKPGDPVVVSLLTSCGKCRYCVTGLPHLCVTKGSYDVEGYLRNNKGQGLIQKARVAGFAEYVLVDEPQIVKIPAEMPLDLACLLACGVITGFGAVVNRAKVPPMNSVVVIGSGGVGLNAVQGALFCGANPVIAVDVSDDKLKAARVFGATHTVNSQKVDAVESVKQMTADNGADYVFVTVGSLAAQKQGFSMLATRGTLVIVGIPSAREGDLSVAPAEFVLKEKTITGVYMGDTRLSIDVPNLINLYNSGRLKLAELVTGRYPLSRINEAIAAVEHQGALRNIIIFQ
jgi:S-(hydroxymethyl)glutathione dehydrogenase / alcohol dehydrogenase